ncbi:malonate transporter MadL subunit [Azospirillum lipoferum]|uniref:Malonate transporter subunit MadL n=1 Tax=Azospirillum lipoferum TaxID=193 RepID=A0A5A9GRG9_AZOLI|nr:MULTISPECIES: malonate transporter subunit MadL [Azospirillum]KAA0596224.1 malonate transporter subunit MadL [Azospirillum lipoferum]MCP1611189.1 malonate transporter MadL subunit [Azospirillum lipoferum]MDW5533686.1 malonate transporter subunit MadL [Azospirillum sp. NL1]
MVVYGVALLSACMLAGLVAGDLLGILIGVKANVGGVGIAMLLLILFSDHLKRTLRMNALAEQGILFWSAMYIPIVVAMAAQQDVVAAVKGGPAALLAGVLAVVLSFALVPVIARIGQPADARRDASQSDGAGALSLKSGE